jgi:hypothetical protein
MLSTMDATDWAAAGVPTKTKARIRERMGPEKRMRNMGVERWFSGKVGGKL